MIGLGQLGLLRSLAAEERLVRVGFVLAACLCMS